MVPIALLMTGPQPQPTWMRWAVPPLPLVLWPQRTGMWRWMPLRVKVMAAAVLVRMRIRMQVKMEMGMQMEEMEVKVEMGVEMDVEMRV